METEERKALFLYLIEITGLLPAAYTLSLSVTASRELWPGRKPIHDLRSAVNALTGLRVEGTVPLREKG